MPRHSSLAAGPASPSIFQEKKLARLIRATIAIGSGLAVPVANADLDCSPVAPAVIVVDADEINQLSCTLEADLQIVLAATLTNTVTGIINNFETIAVDGTIDDAGDILNHNSIQIGATGRINVSGFLGNGAPGTNSPVLEVADGGTLHIQSGGEFSNYGTTTVDGSVLNDQFYFNDNITVITPTGTIENNFVFNSANILDVEGIYSNTPGASMTVWSGTVNIRDGGRFLNSGNTTIRGHIQADSNGVLINEDTLSIGTAFVTNSTFVALPFSTVSNAIGSTYTNWGENTAGGDTFFDGSAINEGTFITPESGNTVIGSTGDFLNKRLSETFGILNVEGGGEYKDEGTTIIRPGAKLVVGGRYIGNSSSVLIIQSVTNVVSAGGILASDGQLDLDGGLQIEVDGLLAIRPPAVLNLDTGSVLEIDGWAFLDGDTSLSPGSTFINRGSTEFGFPGETNATFTTDFGSVATNAPGGEIANYGTQNINGRYVNEGTDDNFGAVKIGATGEYTVEIGGTLNNHQLIESFGALHIRGTLNDDGETRISGGGHLDLHGNYFGSDDALLHFGNGTTNTVAGVIDTTGQIFIDEDATVISSGGASIRLDSAEVTIEGTAFFNSEVITSNTVIDNRNILEFASTGSALSLDPGSTITNASQAQLTIGGESNVDGTIINNGNLNFLDTVFFRGSLNNHAIARNVGTLWFFDGLIENEDIFQNSGTISQFGEFNNAGLGSGIVQNFQGANWSVNNNAVYVNEASTTNFGSFRVNSGGTLNNTARFENRNFMVLRSGGAMTNATNALVINSSGATLNIEGGVSSEGRVLNQGGEIEVADSGSITGAGSYVQEDGLTIVDGVMDLSDIEFQDGGLKGSGSLVSDNPIVIADNVEVDPGGSVGTLTFESDVTFDGTLNIEIESTTSFDIVDVIGTVTFGAGSEIVFDLVGYTPLAGDTFEFLTALSVGGFENVLVSMPGIDPSLTYSVTVDGEFDLLLQYSNVPIPPSLPLLIAPVAALGLLRRTRLRTANV